MKKEAQAFDLRTRTAETRQEDVVNSDKRLDLAVTYHIVCQSLAAFLGKSEDSRAMENCAKCCLCAAVAFGAYMVCCYRRGEWSLAR